MQTTIDVLDFFFPNGSFTDKKYELISYITGQHNQGDPSPYFIPPSDLPQSETQGMGILDVQGNTFGNLPPRPNDYIQRLRLEEELYTRLVDERHPIITMIGRGGIGKTWLALTVLYRIAIEGKFSAILWFSARDIDLLSEGAKLVKPHILHEGDIATEFVRLLQPSEANIKGFKPISYLNNELTKSKIGPILFVFDNFETVRSPAELFTWIDTYIRLPNKVLITTRYRDFKGDYPVDISGMEVDEAEELVQQTASHLRIDHLLTRNYIDKVLDEADGHPYVIKVLLGEVAKAKALVKIERIIATKDDLLDALFERTYVGLMPVSKRVFLTLCNWRSIVPKIALEAVLLRSVNERMDVQAGIEELERSSFIELLVSDKDKEVFLSVPLVARLFGQRKLEVDPSKSTIMADIELLQVFGAASQSEVQRGINPRLKRLLGNIVNKFNQGNDDITLYTPILEYIARKYNPTWLMIADLYEEIDVHDGIIQSKQAIMRFLENSDDEQEKYKAWYRLIQISRKLNDITGELHALAARAELSTSSINDVSYAAKRLNQVFADPKIVLDIDVRHILAERIVQIMESRIHEANADDLSLLAWLHMNLHNKQKASEYVKMGLELDPYNEYCINLAHNLR